MSDNSDGSNNNMVENRLKKIEDWAIRIDEWKASQSIVSAVAGDRYKNIEKRLDRIDAHIVKLVWLLITSLVIPIGAIAFKTL